MVNCVKKICCILLCFAMIFALSGCSESSNELTEENITATVETATTALKEFDSKTLKKYVDSETLSYIISFADNHEQFAELGKAIFENLSVEVESIDLENKTVTVSVTNKDLFTTALNFTEKLLREHNKIQLLTLLNDDAFLDYSLSKLVDSISKAEMQSTPKTVKLNITQGKKNLILSFDDEAENAVSGGALVAIKSITG